MRVLIVIPVYNESERLRICLDSLVAQTHQPEKLVLVDDNSTDDSFEILQEYSRKLDFISATQTQASQKHLPGGKVVRAFNVGLETVGDKFDVICKFDADLVFPPNYLEAVVEEFSSRPFLGIFGGVCLIQRGDDWIDEVVSDRDHVRGALKAYRQTCFDRMNGLRVGMGWDTVDELLAVYHGFEVDCAFSLKVKHLKPTGQSYSRKAISLKGEAMYRMGYGIVLTTIASTKLYWPRLTSVFTMLRAYLSMLLKGQKKYVTRDEERFIRSYRWKRIFAKIKR